METIVTHQYQASHSNTTRRVIVSAVASALATLMAGNAAMAQTADAAATAATADNAQAARSPSDVAPTNVVTVGGTRKSGASAIDRKIRNATFPIRWWLKTSINSLTKTWARRCRASPACS